MQDPYRSHQPGTALDSNQPPPLADLPPVEAPSASFVVQLFVIPAVVVAVVIVVWLLFGKLAGGERDAMEYVRQLRPAVGQLAIGVRAGQPDPERLPACQRPQAARRADRPAFLRAGPE